MSRPLPRQQNRGTKESSSTPIGEGATLEFRHFVNATSAKDFADDCAQITESDPIIILSTALTALGAHAQTKRFGSRT